MSRVTCWIICSAVVTITILCQDASAPATAMVGFYLLMGVPLFLHWLTEAVK